MKKDHTVLQAKRYGTHHCLRNVSLLKIAQQMVEREINTMVVVDETGYLVGILTRLDILRAYLERDDWGNQLVEHYMQTHIETVTPHETLLHVAQSLINRQIHQVVVVEEEQGKQRPVAILSVTDIMYHIFKDEKEEHNP